MKMRSTYLLVGVMVLLFNQVTSKHCKKGWASCGESLCCCKTNEAKCKGIRINYIPKLPKEITSLTFIENKIGNLSANTFDNVSVSSMEILNLNNDCIENIRNETFTNFTKLKQLSLSNNEKLRWSKVKLAFYSIPSNLRTLNLDNTGLRFLSDDIFEGLKDTAITSLSLKYNRIHIFNEKAFYFLQQLRTLDLNHNSIREISATKNETHLGHKTLEKLLLANNKFVYWPPWLCGKNATRKDLYPKLKSLNLEGSAIMILRREAWSCLRSLEELNLARNVIQTFQNDIFLDLGSLTKLQVSYMAKPVKKIEPKAFHIPNLGELHFENNFMNFKKVHDVPYGKMFAFCRNLTKLYLGFNYLRSVTDTHLVKLLSPLSKLKVLHLDGAHLHKIPDNIFSKFVNLTELYLGKNKIDSINPRAFVNVSNLEVLHLDGNRIKVIDDTFPMALRRSLREVNFQENPFSCLFCVSNNNTWFRNWLDISMSRIKFLGWPDHYKCASPPSEHGTLLKKHMPKEKDCEIKDPMIVAYATIGIFVGVFVIVGTLGYRGRWYIRYWTIKYARKCVSRAKDDPERQRLLENGFMYDVYVIYHDDNRRFIREEMLIFMENEHNYKLFVWDRDFTAGDQSVGIVVDSIYKSNHVIAVISKSFIEDQWCDFQLAVSLDRQVELKRNFLTLIILDDFDKKLLSKYWCVLLTKTTTTEWCDKKDDVRRKLFEQTILSNVPCMSNRAKKRECNQ